MNSINRTRFAALAANPLVLESMIIAVWTNPDEIGSLPIGQSFLLKPASVIPFHLRRILHLILDLLHIAHPLPRVLILRAIAIMIARPYGFAE
jgi:hypothetical protein